MTTFRKLIFDILSPSTRLKSWETVRVIISKVGGKLWRKEGYIPSWRFDQTSYILFIKLLNFHPQYCTWTATIKQDLGDSSPNRPTFTLVVIKIYQKVRTSVYDCSRRYEISYVLHGVRLFSVYRTYVVDKSKQHGWLNMLEAIYSNISAQNLLNTLYV